MSDIKAELIDCMGDDLRVVNAARVSFDKESSWETEEVDVRVERLGDKDVKLVRYLAKHGHWTPFSHPMITLREEVPIFVARQRFKHMVGFTYNEVSRRYVDDAPEFYIPKYWRARPEGSVKQGSGDDLVNGLRVFYQGNKDDIPDVYRTFVQDVRDLYDQLIKKGVAPEQARMVLPQSMMTSYYVTGSLAAFARAYKQRSDPHAQKEIQDLAAEWDRLIRPRFPVSWGALVDA